MPCARAGSPLCTPKQPYNRPVTVGNFESSRARGTLKSSSRLVDLAPVRVSSGGFEGIQVKQHVVTMTKEEAVVDALLPPAGQEIEYVKHCMRT